MAGSTAGTEVEPGASGPDVVIDLDAPHHPGEVGTPGPPAEPAPPPPPPLTVGAVRLWLGLIGLVSLLFAVPGRPGTFLMSFWALSYQRGYRARALPASVLQLVGAARVTQRLVAWISVVLLLAVLVMLAELGARGYRVRPTWTTFGLGALLVGSPATLRSFGFELASLDNIVLCLTLGGLLLLLAPGGGWRLLAVGGLATAGVLVHEAFVLLTLPLLLAAVVVRDARAPWRRTAARLMVVATGPAVALLWVQSAGTLPRSEVPRLVAEARSVAEVDPEAESVAWPIYNHTRDLDTNVSYTAAQVAARGHGQHLLALVACVPSLVAAAGLAGSVLPAAGRARLAVLWASVTLAPLTLAVVGHDWGRWLVYATFAAVVAAGWSVARVGRPRPRSSPHPVVAQVVVVALAVALMTPPLARAGSFRVRVAQPGALVELLLGR